MKEKISNYKKRLLRPFQSPKTKNQLEGWKQLGRKSRLDQPAERPEGFKREMKNRRAGG